MGNTVKKVTSGLVWTYAERITAQLITVFVTIILARLIEPSEYGLISIVSIFISIANSFVTSGFGNSLIQKKDADDVDFSTVFFFSVVLAVIIYGIVFACAPFIADFYMMPQLILVTRIMAVRLPIAAVNSVQQAYISKRMEFKKFFFATLGGTVFSAVLGIGMAYSGFGIWALIAQYLSNVCIDTVVLSVVSGWKPTCVFSRQRMKSLFSYGWKIMVVGVMTTVYSNLRNLIIGKRYSAADLAFSEKGEQFPAAIAGNVNSSISKVLFPVLSEAQDNIDHMRRMVRRSIKIGCYILFPAMFGFASVADTFVVTFLTVKWSGCIPFLRIMCAVYALQPLQTSALQGVKALGKSGLYLWIDVIKKVMGLLILFGSIFLYNKVYFIVLGALVTEIFSVLILFPVNKKLLNYGYRSQFFDVFPIIATTLVMCLGIYAANQFIIFDGFTKLVIDVIIGLIIYLVISVFSKNENFYYILSIMKGRIKR